MSEIRICENCGHHNPVDNLECEECGFDLSFCIPISEEMARDENTKEKKVTDCALLMEKLPLRLMVKC